MYDLNNIGQQEKTTGVGDFFRGIGTGLHSLVEHKTKELQRQKDIDRLQSMGFNPRAAELLNYIREVDPGHFTSVMQSLGEGAYQQSPQEVQYPEQKAQPEELVKEQITEPSGEKISIQKEIAKPKSLFEDKEAKKQSHEEQKLINKEVHSYIKDIRAKGKGAKENDIRLRRMDKLIESGNLNNPTFVSLLRSLKHGIGGYIGLDLTGTLSPETQEFDKLSNDFVKNIKDIFGSRITDQDLKSFMATVPQSTQTNAGKRAVINNLKLFNEAAQIREQAANRLLKKYGNKPPLDFEEQVENLVKPELDEIAKRFESGINKGEKIARDRSLIQDVIGGRGLNLLERA